MESSVLPDEITLVLPARPSYLALARVIITSVASTGPSLQESRLADLRLIVSEIYTNAMEANWEATQSRLGQGTSGRLAPPQEDVLAASDPVTLRCRAGLHEVEVVVEDRGFGFDNTDDPHPPQHDPTRLDFEHGLGIPLIQFLSDEVDYFTGPNGTTVRVLVRDVESSGAEVDAADDAIDAAPGYADPLG